MPENDPRPPVWIGHVTLPTPDLAETWTFMLKLGMRDIVKKDEVGVLELRGGTHLVLLPCEAKAEGAAYFDLMVDDVPGTHEQLTEQGLGPSEISKGTIHDSFTVTSPSGHVITFNSTHVSDQPV